MGFETLSEIKRDNEAAERRATAAPPLACPVDGALLEVRGTVRNCPLGNYTWENGQVTRSAGGDGWAWWE